MIKCWNRYKKPFYYAQYDHTEYTDSGEAVVKYKTPVLFKAHVGSTTGDTQVDPVGTVIDYDSVIVTDDMSCPIDENTVLAIPGPFGTDDDGNLLYTHIVKRVAKTPNIISIRIKQVMTK